MLATRKQRWIAFLIAIAIGIGIGLYYGWVAKPVQYTDIAPTDLRADFKADFVLMVAEAYQNEHDLESARRALGLLGSDPQSAIQQALAFAMEHNYASQDVLVLQNLLTALQNQSNAGGAP